MGSARQKTETPASIISGLGSGIGLSGSILGLACTFVMYIIADYLLAASDIAVGAANDLRLNRIGGLNVGLVAIG